MKTIQLKCPSCGAELEAEDGLDTFYCKYCGQKIVLTGRDKMVIGAKVVKDILNHRERMYEKQMEEERRKRRESDIAVLIALGVMLLIGLLFFLMPD